MRRRYRIGATVAGFVLALLLVVGLTWLGDRSEGPLEGTLRRIGGMVTRVERALVDRVRGPGRRAGLEWLAPYRTDPAALRDPERILVGAYHESIPGDFQGVIALEEATGAPFALVHGYFAWGDRPDQEFPHRFAAAVAELGSIPVITWEPWLTDFENRLHPHLPLREDRDRGGLAAIARGDYDFYVDEWARAAAAHRGPILLRFAHEMNDPYRYPWGPQNNEPWEFVEAWNHVVARFRSAGAENVLWVWSPHVAYAGYEWFWPGDPTVDWVATGALNYGAVAQWSQWWTFGEIFGDRYEGLAGFGKPVMIAELGSLAVGGDRVAWYRDALDALPERHPALKAVLFFEVSADATITYQELDWAIVGDSAITRIVADARAAWGEPAGEGRP